VLFNTSTVLNLQNNVAIDTGPPNSTLSVAGTMTGGFGFTKTGPGTLTLSGNNSYTGLTVVSGGALLINGNQSAATGAVTVASGATLSGTGTTGGDVTIADGGHLVGVQGQLPLTMNSLTLNSLSQVDVSLANPSTSALFNINGNGGGPGASNLTLAGKLNVTAVGPFGPGVYRIMDYTGLLTNNVMTFGTVPPGFTPNVDLLIQTSVLNQVNLVNNKSGGPLTFWDGGDSSLFNNHVVDGGSGTWSVAGLTSWTNSAGSVNATWEENGFAIFQGAHGTVTVDNSAGTVKFSGAQFAVDGYIIAGEPLMTDTADTIIRVGDGTSSGASMTATIAATIQGTGGLEKTDLGTLILTEPNTFSGGLTISGGTLGANNDGNLGEFNGPLLFNGGTLESLSTGGGINSNRTVTLNGGGGTFLADAGTDSTFSGPINWYRLIYQTR
jgi:fibronectin-binding autotransporter adhesin